VGCAVRPSSSRPGRVSRQAVGHPKGPRLRALLLAAIGNEVGWPWSGCLWRGLRGAGVVQGSDQGQVPGGVVGGVVGPAAPDDAEPGAGQHRHGVGVVGAAGVGVDGLGPGTARSAAGEVHDCLAQATVAAAAEHHAARASRGAGRWGDPGLYAARYTHLTTRTQNPLHDGQARAAIAAALLRQLFVVLTRRAAWDPTLAGTTATETPEVAPLAA